ncbi:hypothetical protein GX586_00635, partial [bacterium]|nr:hypothetical protein [bacterium]
AIDWRGDVRNVLVQRCVMHNDYAGNVMEIGFETRADRIGDIVFRDCDVIAVRGHGAVFSIHNGDRALVENVLYENIRVEHYYDKFVDFRVLDSRYSKDHERGRIRNVTLRNIAAVANTHNTVSLIGGFDEEHLVEHVTFDRFFLGGEKVRDADGLHLFAKYAKGIGFR